MPKTLDIEALDKLIKAVEDYKNSLNQNKNILLNAANACEVAMGKEEISKKKIGKLKTALTELNKAAEYVEAVAQDLRADKAKALAVLDDMY